MELFLQLAHIVPDPNYLLLNCPFEGVRNEVQLALQLFLNLFQHNRLVLHFFVHDHDAFRLCGARPDRCFANLRVISTHRECLLSCDWLGLGLWGLDEVLTLTH